MRASCYQRRILSYILCFMVWVQSTSVWRAVVIDVVGQGLSIQNMLVCVCGRQQRGCWGLVNSNHLWLQSDLRKFSDLKLLEILSWLLMAINGCGFCISPWEKMDDCVKHGRLSPSISLSYSLCSF